MRRVGGEGSALVDGEGYKQGEKIGNNCVIRMKEAELTAD